MPTATKRSPAPALAGVTRTRPAPRPRTTAPRQAAQPPTTTLTPDEIAAQQDHIVFVIDKSGSMYYRSNDVVKVVDDEIKWLAKISEETGREIRVSVYLFNEQVTCVIYDKDVLRLPSIARYYLAGGATAMIDATKQAISELRQTPALYGDHAFLTYVVGDGAETENIGGGASLARLIDDLPENWTVAAMVPDEFCARNAKRYGFSDGNVSLWHANRSDGVVGVGLAIRAATTRFIEGRKSGVRGTKTLFLDVANLTQAEVRSNLTPLKSGTYKAISVKAKAPLSIREFVEANGLHYKRGTAYYQISKSETIQDYKGVVIYDKKARKYYTGDAARELLGLPDHSAKARLDVDAHPQFKFFIQSTSVNRRLVPKTTLLVLNPSKL